MLFVTAALVVLLAVGIFLAGRELAGFEPEPAWKDVGRLRERLAEELPAVPLHRVAGRAATIEYCRGLLREFRFAWRLCRFLAPITSDAGYVGTLMMIKLRFHGLLALALAHAAVGRSATCDRVVRELRELSMLIRSSAVQILTESDLEHGFTPA